MSKADYFIKMRGDFPDSISFRDFIESQKEKSITHSDHMKDYLFDDGSIIRIHSDSIYELKFDL